MEKEALEICVVAPLEPAEVGAVQVVKIKPEGALRDSLLQLRALLSEPGCPRFTEFWKIRRESLALFKENIPLKLRVDLWKEFSALSAEARQLKEILDEASAFAVEQIELAILAIERDVENRTMIAERMQNEIDFEGSVTLQHRRAFYESAQKEMGILNSLASKTQALRQELIKTQMRIRVKNGLFDRLSACGDLLFPRRRELMELLSEAFLTDVEAFKSLHFGEDNRGGRVPLYALREEIKQVQNLARQCALTPSTFAKVRGVLGACWDELRKKEGERKASLEKQREAERQMSAQEAELRLKREEEEAKRKLKCETFQKALSELELKMSSGDLSQLDEERQKLSLELPTIPCMREEKLMFERQLRSLRDMLAEKKQLKWMHLSEGSRGDVEKLYAALDEGLIRRDELKMELEEYRRVLGSSGFDFEKAMMYRELIEAQRQALVEVNAAIEDIESKIAVLGE